ncbi:hypothetical protein [Thermogutta sp.]|uniref:hypothetical protein n=1 Tax=Thermogutta sp. TaxID=1962930 RepID=UPI0032208A23
MAERQMHLESDDGKTHDYERTSQGNSENQPELRAQRTIQKPLQIFAMKWEINNRLDESGEDQGNPRRMLRGTIYLTALAI